MTSPELDRLRAALGADAPLTWVATGDSITHGLVHTCGERSYPEHLHELIRGELGRVRDIVVNSAISGHRIVQILDDFERRVSSWSPDVVTLMIGTNDCSTAGVWPVIEPGEFAASITEFVTRVRGLGAVPVLQTPPSVDVAAAPERARIAAFAEAIREVAAREDVLLADQSALFDEEGGGGVPWGLMNDPFHPNAAGHAALALGLARVLGLAPAASRTLPLLTARVAAARIV